MFFAALVNVFFLPIIPLTIFYFVLQSLFSSLVTSCLRSGLHFGPFPLLIPSKTKLVIVSPLFLATRYKNRNSPNFISFILLARMVFSSFNFWMTYNLKNCCLTNTTIAKNDKFYLFNRTQIRIPFGSQRPELGTMPEHDMMVPSSRC